MQELEEVRDLIKAGKLSESRTKLATLIRDEPQNLSLRNAYFEALCFQGDFDRARKQLEAIATLGTSQDPALQDHRFRALTDLYHNAMTAETARTQFFSEGRVPTMLRKPPENIRKRLQAAMEIRSGDIAAASQCVRQAESLECPLNARMNGALREGFREADDLLAPILEFHASSGDYYWIELDLVQSIHPGPVRFWLHTLWRPATIVFKAGDPLNGLIPALYYGSSSSSNEAVQLGRTTEWSGSSDTIQRGSGQRLFLSGEESFPVLEFDTLEFVSPGMNESHDIAGKGHADA